MWCLKSHVNLRCINRKIEPKTSKVIPNLTKGKLIEYTNPLPSQNVLYPGVTTVSGNTHAILHWLRASGLK